MDNFENSKKPAPRAVLRNILPALAVMVAGLIGAYLVYDNYLADRGVASQMAGMDPAAGEAMAQATAPAAAPATISNEGADSSTNATMTSGSPNAATMQPPMAPASSPTPQTAP